MPVTKDKPAPYAPASAILALVEKHRSRGLPTPIDADVLARAGVSESLVPRTLQSLHTLDLLNEDGSPSETLEGLRLAPQAEYQQRLGDWLKGTYADALSFIDPSADEVAIADAFRSYTPTGQRGRMVTLFMGLFAAAGLREERPRATPRPPTKPAAAFKAKPKPASRSTPEVEGQASARDERPPPPAAGVPPPLSAMVADLPRVAQNWKQADRERFQDAFGMLLDLYFPVSQ